MCDYNALKHGEADNIEYTTITIACKYCQDRVKTVWLTNEMKWACMRCYRQPVESIQVKPNA